MQNVTVQYYLLKGRSLHECQFFYTGSIATPNHVTTSGCFRSREWLPLSAAFSRFRQSASDFSTNALCIKLGCVGATKSPEVFQRESGIRPNQSYLALALKLSGTYCFIVLLLGDMTSGGM